MNDSADSATVSEIQKDVLQRLRLGQELRTSHHEGGTRLFFDGQSFLREDYGEDPWVKRYETNAAMIECLESFWRHDAERACAPGRATALDIWNFILARTR